MDIRTKGMKSELMEFQHQLDDLKQRLLIAKAELANAQSSIAGNQPGLSRGSDGTTTATVTSSDDSSSANRFGGKPSTSSSSSSSLQDEVKAMEKELKAKEAEFRVRTAQLKKREDAMEKFKGREKERVERANALNIERKRSVIRVVAVVFVAVIMPDGSF